MPDEIKLEEKSLDVKMCVPMTDVKLLEDDDSPNFVIEGFGSTFGNADLVDDIVQAGAFRKTIINRKTPVKLLFNHNSNKPLGIWTELRETDKGLFGKAIMPKSSALAQEMKAMLDVGALDSLSIGFRIKEFTIKDGIRIIEEADLREISIVTFPANEEAIVTNVKNIDDAKALDAKAIEEILQASGKLSNSACKYLAGCFQQKQCEAADEEDENDNLNQCESEEDGEKSSDDAFWAEMRADLSEIKNIISKSN